MDKVRVIEVAKGMLPKGSHLLYLTEFGSRLYGTATKDSDYDYQGLYIPDLKDLALMKTSKSCRFSTGNDVSKNTHEDFDIQVWSIQYWLLDLMPKMDTVALDLYFSSTNEDATLFKNGLLDWIFRNSDNFIDSGKISNSAYIRYAMSQARRYGVKGSKLHLLRELERFLSKFEENFHPIFMKESRLETIADAILAKFERNEYLSSRSLQDGSEALQICGKYYPYHLTLEYFTKCMREAVDRYGERARMAENNEGIDWKALSHAVRAVYQAIELSQTGLIKFPFKEEVSEDLISIKKGERTFDEVSSQIERGIETIDSLQPAWEGKYSSGLAMKLIWQLYGL